VLAIEVKIRFRGSRGADRTFGEEAMSEKNKTCQSCGMPMKRDEKGGGTNVDGSRNSLYCSHCFSNGKFTLPDITVLEMQERVRTKLKEFGFPSFLAGMMTKKIPKLGRWKATGDRA